MDPEIRFKRRDLYKLALGAAAAAPVANAQLDQLLAAEPASRDHPLQPWWVREVDKPTVEIDWDNMQRFDEWRTTRGSFADYVGKERADELNRQQDATVRKNITTNKPGFRLRDYAINDCWMAGSAGYSFLGPRKVKTPEQRGVPKWTGTPEEAAEMVRAMMRHAGAAQVGFVHLDEKTRKLIYAHDPVDAGRKELVFSDDDLPSETATQRIIPNKAEWVIVYTMQMSFETLRRAPTETGCQTTMLTYARANVLQGQLQEFLRGLGYYGLGEASLNALGIAPAFGVLAGLGELGRTNRMISPEHGTMVRVYKLITNLPLPSSRPIDAGIADYCRTCKKCAESCPAGALSMDREPTWQVKGPWNNPGHKAYFDDSIKCMTFWRQNTNNCTTCFAVCPFAKKDKALLHNLVKAAVSRTAAFDAAFRMGDDVMGYGQQPDPDSWWKMDLPEYGIDTTRGHRDV